METFENASINLENYEEYVEMNLTAQAKVKRIIISKAQMDS